MPLGRDSRRRPILGIALVVLVVLVVLLSLAGGVHGLLHVDEGASADCGLCFLTLIDVELAAPLPSTWLLLEGRADVPLEACVARRAHAVRAPRGPPAAIA